MKHEQVQQLARRVIELYYPEISSKSISVNISIVPEPWALEDMSVQLEKGSILVSGKLPEVMMNDPNIETILTGLLGHEFSHLIRSSYNGLQSLLNSKFFDRLTYIRNRVDLALERVFDRETLKRGLGHQLCEAISYLEQFKYLNQLATTPRGYDSSQLLKRIGQR